MRTTLLLILALTSLVASVQIWENGFIVEELVKSSMGPSFIGGKLGILEKLEAEHASDFVFRKLQNLFSLDHRVKFIFERSETDFSGMMHFRFNQRINDLHVEHGKLIVHVHPRSHEVFALTSAFAPGYDLPSQPTVEINQAKESIMSLVPSTNFRIISGPELMYLKFEGNINLVYRADIIYNIGGDEMRSYFYLDAMENTLVVELNRYINALDRDVYTANNGRLLPGTLVRTEGSLPSTDSTVNDAYTYTGVCYDYYYQTFGRDSYDNRGATMISTVHYGNDYNNAFWNSEQMVFGDGDGVTFSDFAADLTVVCHELTHAVVEYTAALIYSKESGALNEGFADIFGFSAYMYQYGADTQYQWMIGAECYTPNKAGDALRYMNNPPLDGSSYDYYPGYTGILDNGGVHWNSGIANLAYVLAVQGGTHPQDKSTIFVNGIGTSAAEQIFYTVLAQYLSADSQFADARAASVTAARAAYGTGSKQAQTANDCWEAVGVPSSTV